MKTSLIKIAALAIIPLSSIAISTHPADQIGTEIWIADGYMPAMDIDSRNRLHLIYAEGRNLYYRTGDIDGNFGEPELVITLNTIWEPRIFIDENDDPHVVLGNGYFRSRYTYYMNRIGGQWRPGTPTNRLVVFDRDRDGFDRAIIPSISVADGRAYVGTFTAGGDGRFANHWGAIARIGSLADNPRVEGWSHVRVWNPQVIYTEGRLWAGGKNVSVGGRGFAMAEHNPETMREIDPSDPGYVMSFSAAGEMSRARLDYSGDILAAGTRDVEGPSFNAGWFQSVSRIKDGRIPVRYRTSLANLNGMGTPIRDRVAPDRYYVIHWTDEADTTYEPSPFSPPECPETVQMRFVRIQDGVKASEMQHVTNRTNPHGSNFRLTPCAVPHPRGGAIVVFRECQGSGIFLNTIGEQVGPEVPINPFITVRSRHTWKDTWYGVVNDAKFPWIHSRDKGWQYMHGSTDSVWIYDPSNETWIWSSPDTHPWVWFLRKDGPSEWINSSQS